MLRFYEKLIKSLCKLDYKNVTFPSCWRPFWLRTQLLKLPPFVSNRLAESSLVPPARGSRRNANVEVGTADAAEESACKPL